MNTVLKITLILGLLGYFTLIFFFLKRKALTLKYSLLWLATGFLMILAILFLPIVEWVARIFGIASVVNAVFALQLFFQMIILISITSIVSKHNEKTKQLIQQLGILEKRLRDLESQTKF